MLNFRQIDKNFCLSGGWQDLDSDLENLHQAGIRFIIDVGLTPADEYATMVAYTQERAEAIGIEYVCFPMYDDEFNDDVEYSWDLIADIIAGAEKTLSRKEKILIKCGAGVSRSVSTFIYFLCQNKRMSAREALNYIRDAERFKTEFGASPNTFFWNILRKKFPEAGEY
jgi:protein-tyrosine phosphatase